MKEKTNWPMRVIIGVGIANVAFGIDWLWNVLYTASYLHGHPSKWPSYLHNAWYTSYLVNTLLAICLAATGVYLIRKNTRAVLYCNILFVLEFLRPAIQFLCSVWYGIHLHDTTRYLIVSIATTLLDYGQRKLHYPLIALLVLNIAKAQLRKTVVPGSAVEEGKPHEIECKGQ